MGVQGKHISALHMVPYASFRKHLLKELTNPELHDIYTMSEHIHERLGKPTVPVHGDGYVHCLTAEHLAGIDSLVLWPTERYSANRNNTALSVNAFTLRESTGYTGNIIELTHVVREDMIGNYTHTYAGQPTNNLLNLNGQGKNTFIVSLFGPTGYIYQEVAKALNAFAQGSFYNPSYEQTPVSMGTIVRMPQKKSEAAVQSEEQTV